MTKGLLMEKKIIIAGFGGQGVILSGVILAQAGVEANLKVALVPSYGPEMRGGTAHCDVILNDTDIFSPIIVHPDILVAFNQPSLECFVPKVVESGLVLYNSDLCTPDQKRDGLVYHGIPANGLATNLGNHRIANVIMLGALVGLTGLFPAEAVLDFALTAVMTKEKAKLIPINRKAFSAGWEHARGLSSAGQ